MHARTHVHVQSQAVGAADFIAMANAFHTVFIEGIPELGLKDLNQV